jgi:acetyl esterase
VPIDDATAAFLAAMAQAGPPVQDLDPPAARTVTAALRPLYGAGPAQAAVHDVKLPVAGGVIELRVLRPITSSPRGVLLYLHGGGWVIGSIEEYDTLGRILADRTGMTTVLAGYRKAPEYQYPTPVEDAWVAVGWADQHRGELAADGAPLVIAGDSAGGNLAAVCALRARDAGGPRIDAQVLVYPATRLDRDYPSYHEPENQLLLSADSMRWFVDHYIPADRRTEVDASPGRAETLVGLPPTIMLTAEFDPLRDEGDEYAARLEAAGVPVQARRFERQMHAFFQMVNILPGSGEGIDYVVDCLDRLFPR